MSFELMSEPCDQCLMTKNKIVSDARRKKSFARPCVKIARSSVTRLRSRSARSLAVGTTTPRAAGRSPGSLAD